MLLLTASAVMARWTRRLDAQVAAHAAQLARTAAVQAEAMRMQQANARLAEWQQVTQETIEGGSEAVRAVHMGIAAIPFSIFEAIPRTRQASKLLRRVHDLTSDSVYSAISTVNRLVGEISREKLGEPTASKLKQARASDD